MKAKSLLKQISIREEIYGSNESYSLYIYTTHRTYIIRKFQYVELDFIMCELTNGNNVSISLNSIESLTFEKYDGKQKYFKSENIQDLFSELMK